MSSVISETLTIVTQLLYHEFLTMAVHKCWYRALPFEIYRLKIMEYPAVRENLSEVTVLKLLQPNLIF